MIGFRGLKEDDDVSHDAAITKEAQEASNRRMYEDALRLQQKGSVHDAEHKFTELLGQPLIQDLRVELGEGKLSPEKDMMAYLKYLAHKNLAGIQTAGAYREDRWREGLGNYAEAVEIDATDITVWYKMGIAASQANELSLARFALEGGLAVNSKHWPSLELLVEVRRAPPFRCASTAFLLEDSALPCGPPQVLFSLGDDTGCQLAVDHALRLNPFFARGLELRKGLEPGSTEAVEHRWLSPQAYNTAGQQEQLAAVAKPPVVLTVESWPDLLSQLVQSCRPDPTGRIGKTSISECCGICCASRTAVDSAAKSHRALPCLQARFGRWCRSTWSGRRRPRRDRRRVRKPRRRALARRRSATSCANSSLRSRTKRSGRRSRRARPPDPTARRPRQRHRPRVRSWGWERHRQHRRHQRASQVGRGQRVCRSESDPRGILGGSGRPAGRRRPRRGHRRGPMNRPRRRCLIREVSRGLQLQSLWRIPTAAVS